MTRTALVVMSLCWLAVSLPATPAAAQSRSALGGDSITSPKASAATKASPKSETKAKAKACSEYGAGFRQLEGTGSCVKIGGYVRYQTGRSW